MGLQGAADVEVGTVHEPEELVGRVGDPPPEPEENGRSHRHRCEENGSGRPLGEGDGGLLVRQLSVVHHG